MIGQTVSHYRVLEKLGGGGMGVVYKAQDLKLERSVALKFLPPDLTRDAEARLRFVHEAKAASALQHDNICVVHDIDETADGQTFIVLDYYQGQTVKKLLAAGPLPVERAIDVAIQVGEGLAEAHLHGIVHRDIKPANIMITSQGKARIVDFGVALLAGLTRVTTDGHKVGTVTHMSPEQARGEPVDHRSDIWSLGVLLYEMLSGRLPFDSSYEQALVYAILNSEPPLLSSVCPDAPRGLDPILRKALAKDPRLRYQKIEQMVVDLKKIAGQPAGSQVARITMGLLSSLAGKRRVVIPAAVLLVALVAAGLWLFREKMTLEMGPPRQVGVHIVEVRSEIPQGEGAGWARAVEDSYLPGELAGREHVVVYHEGSGGGDVRFDVRGEIMREESLYVLQVRLQDPETGRVRYSANSLFRGKDGLKDASSAVSKNILWFLEIRVFNPDIDPWMPHSVSDSASSAFLKAMTYTYAGRPGSGAFLEEALRLDSTFIAPRVWLVPGLALWRTPEKYEAARMHYQVLQRMRWRASPFELAMIDLAGCYLGGDLQCRATALERGLRFAPGNRIVLVNLGLAYFRLERYDRAAEAYEPAIRSGMPYVDAYWEYARVLVKLGRFDEARAVLQRGLSITPVPAYTYDFLAAFSWKDGDTAQARKFELRSMEGADGVARRWDDVCASEGKVLLDLGEPEAAVRYLRSAVAERPGAASRRAVLAKALIASGDTSGGLMEANSALRIDSSCTEAIVLLGRLAEARGALEEARAHYRRYVELDSVTVTGMSLRRRLAEMRP